MITLAPSIAPRVIVIDPRQEIKHEAVDARRFPANTRSKHHFQDSNELQIENPTSPPSKRSLVRRRLNDKLYETAQQSTAYRSFGHGELEKKDNLTLWLLLQLLPDT